MTDATRAVLRHRIEPVRSLTEQDRSAAYAVFAGLYEGTDRARFDEDLAAKDVLITLRDSGGVIRGFSSAQVRRQTTALGETMVLFSGDTAIDQRYWGQKGLQLGFVRLVARAKLRHPLTPLVWLLVSKGFRTYLLMSNNFQRSVPVQADLEPRLRPVLDQLAAERFGDRYDKGAGVVRNDADHEWVDPTLNTVSGSLATSNRHVARFVQLNPGHLRGDELACLAEIRFGDVAHVARRYLQKRQAGGHGRRTA